MDDDLWTPSTLGCLGRGYLGELGLEVDDLYRPLLTAHGLDLDAPEGYQGTAELVTGDGAWDRLCAEPEVLAAHPGRLHLRDDPDAIVEAVRSWPGHGLRTVLALRIDRLEPRVADLAVAWQPHGVDTGPLDLLVADDWLALFRAAVACGVVGVTADVAHTDARQVEVLRRQLGFRSLAEIYGEVGLGAVDARVELDRWHATVSATGEVDVRLDRHHDDPVACTELTARLARLLARRNDDGLEAPGVAVRVRGEVTFDGCRGWSSGAVAEDEREQREALHAALRCLGRWADAHS